MSSGHTFGGTCLSAKCGGQVYVAYACRYLTGRKLLVEDVILRLRYVAAVSTRRMQVKSACPFRNSASEFCRTVGASPRRRAVAQLRRGPRLSGFTSVMTAVDLHAVTERTTKKPSSTKCWVLSNAKLNWGG